MTPTSSPSADDDDGYDDADAIAIFLNFAGDADVDKMMSSSFPSADDDDDDALESELL